MKLRAINNLGSPLVDSVGNTLAGAVVSFQLIDRYGRPVRNVMDAVSSETVSPGTATATANSGGVFSVNLWPTSRGVNSYYYRVRVKSAVGRVVADFNCALPDGDVALPWAEFMALAGLWSDSHPLTSDRSLTLVEPDTGTKFGLGVAIDSDTQQPTITFTEVGNG
jgi:hypothetical protein